MLFNLPNMLTLSRIVAIPLVVACFWLDRGWAQWLSMMLFVIAAVTDWFDGYFARRYHQISRFGRFLDPIADKLLVAAALVMLVDNHTLRVAMAKASDAAQYAKVIDLGINTPMSGMFLPGSPYYSKTSYPKPDPKGAAKLIKQIEAAGASATSC